MATTESTRIRLLALHDKFYSGRTFTVRQLMDELATSAYRGLKRSAIERIIQKDLSVLLTEGLDNQPLPLQRSKDGRQYFYNYTHVDFEIKSAGLTTENFELLNQVLLMIDHTNLFGELAQLLGRINALAPKTVADTMKARHYLFFDDRHADYAGRDFMKPVCDLIAKETAITIQYKPFGKSSPSTLVMHPYSVREYNMRFYVCGIIEGQPERQSNLALDRILDIPEPNTEIPYITNPFGEDYYASVIGLTIPETGKEEDVHLAFSSARAPYVITKPIHRSQKTEQELPDGRYLIRLKLIVNQELESVILSFGSDCEVLSPSTLRQTVQDKLIAAKDGYYTPESQSVSVSAMA